MTFIDRHLSSSRNCSTLSPRNNRLRRVHPDILIPSRFILLLLTLNKLPYFISTRVNFRDFSIRSGPTISTKRFTEFSSGVIST